MGKTTDTGQKKTANDCQGLTNLSLMPAAVVEYTRQYALLLVKWEICINVIIASALLEPISSYNRTMIQNTAPNDAVQQIWLCNGQTSTTTRSYNQIRLKYWAAVGAVWLDV